jgi:AraC family transcriptional regulator of adaptative response / DNA-3-methyladenine glycosylase II
LVSGHLDLGPGCDRSEARDVLRALPGVGPWTVEMVAMRALGDPDAFCEGDLGVRRAAIRLGLPETPGALRARSERWRPWRAYAVQYLWATSDHPINAWPPVALPTIHQSTKEPIHA